MVAHTLTKLNTKLPLQAQLNKIEKNATLTEVANDLFPNGLALNDNFINVLKEFNVHGYVIKPVIENGFDDGDMKFTVTKPGMAPEKWEITPSGSTRNHAEHSFVATAGKTRIETDKRNGTAPQIAVRMLDLYTPQ